MGEDNLKQKRLAMMVLGLFITSVIVFPAVTVAYAGDQEQVEESVADDWDEESLDEGTQSSGQEEWAGPEDGQPAEDVIDQD